MAVDLEQVEASVQVVVEEEQPEAEDAAARRADAGGDRLVAPQRRVPLRDVEGGHLVREIRDGEAELAVVAEVGGVGAHRPGRGAVAAVGKSVELPVLGEPAAAVVDQQEVAHGVVRHHDVDVAVSLDVHRRQPEGLRHRRVRRRVQDVQTGLLRDVGEHARAVVPIEVHRRAAVVDRRPVGPPDAGQRVVDLDVDLPRPAHVVADQEIEVAVSVGVEEGAAAAPLGGSAGDAGGSGHVLEAAARRVPEQPVRPHRGDEQIGPAVVVHVADRDARAVEARRQTERRGAIREAPGAVVLVQRHRRTGPSGGARRTGVPQGVHNAPFRRVHEQQVLVAVVVEVEERRAGAHRLRQQRLALGAVDVDEVDAGLRGHVGEGDRRNLGRLRHRTRRGDRDLPCLLGRRPEDEPERQDQERGNRQRRQHLQRTSQRAADDRIVLRGELAVERRRLGFVGRRLFGGTAHGRRLVRALVSRPVGAQPPPPPIPARSPSKRPGRCRS